jgi:antitoxin VapB
MRHANLLDPALLFPHSHSIVPGGFDVTSYTTRLTPLISLMMGVRDARGNELLPGLRPRPLQKNGSRLRISQLDMPRDHAMTSSTVFTSNRSQAVRLPKAVAFPEDVHQVDILKIGRSRVIVPQGKRWDDLFQNGPRASEDFMVEREQPPAEEREPL